MARLDSSLTDSLDQMKLRYVDVDGVRTRYYQEGSGDALVLLHGWDPGRIASLGDWSLNFKGLARHFQVYALDRIGQGFTGNPQRDDDYTQGVITHHIIRWLEILNVRNAHLVGHSRGGLLAAEVAFAVPDRVKTIVIVNSGTLAPDPDDPRLHSDLFYAEIDRRTPPGLPTRESLRVAPEALSYSTAHITDEYIERNLQIALLPAQLDAAARMKGGLNDRVFIPNLEKARAEALRRIDERGLPRRTLVIWSRNDRSVPLVEVGVRLYERICARTPETEMHVFNHAGHYTYREHPEEFNRVVKNFCLA